MPSPSPAHSPGPWKLQPFMNRDGFYVDGPEGNAIVMVTKNENREADARLIAAAPDLLAACKHLLASHQFCEVSSGKDCECGRCICCEARAAVSKAEGRDA